MRKPVLLAVAGAGLFIAALDAYVVVTLLPAMMGDVGLTIEHFEQGTPIVTGFLAGYVVAMPLLGAYSDVRGRIPIYLLCLAAFVAGSTLTATADLLPWLVAGRFVQGLGGGGLVPLTLALAADLYSGPVRVVALGSVAALQEAGSVIGPIYGATLAAAAAGLGGWRFVFWFNLPLALICGAGLFATSRQPAASEAPTQSSIDWISAVLLGAGLGLLVLALYPDDPEHRATNALFIPAGVAALLVLGAYAWRQIRQLEPLIPRQLLGSRAFIGATATNILIGVTLMVALVDVPIYGRLVSSLDQLHSGLLLTQFLIGVPIGALLGGIVTARSDSRIVAAVSITLSALAFWQMSFRLDAPQLFACGVGFGGVIAPVTAAVLALTRGESHGLATSLVVLARTIGMLIGLSALTAFGLYRFHQILGTPVLTDPDLRSRVRHLEHLVAAAFQQEYQEIFRIAAVLCVMAAAVSAWSLRPAGTSGGSGTRRQGRPGSP